MVTDPTKIVEDVTKTIDKVTSTDEERDAELTLRQKVDLSSPFKLPHIIRPLLALMSFGLWTICIIWAMILATTYGIEATFSTDSIVLYVLGSVTSVMMSSIGFYFNSRKREKIELLKAQEQVAKSEAAIKIEGLRTKADVKNQKKMDRIRRRLIRKGKLEIEDMEEIESEDQ